MNEAQTRFNIYSKGGALSQEISWTSQASKARALGYARNDKKVGMTRKERRQRRRAFALLHDIIIKVTKA